MVKADKVRFATNQEGDFASTLKTRIDHYFDKQGISKNANFEMTLKTLFYLGGFFALYFLILFGGFSALSSLLMAMLLGAFVAGIGFNISHDAIHGAYSKHRWVNNLMGHTFSIIGANVYTWKSIHNIVHHSYTNIPEADGDLHTVKWLKFFSGGQGLSIHRYQHWYAFALYSLTSLVWVFSKDYVHIRKKKHLIYEKPDAPRREVVQLILFKIAYYIAFILIPILTLPFAWWQVLLGFLAMHLVAGFALALTFQLGHLVEGTEFRSLSAGTDFSDTWTIHQLRSSANFSTQGYWAAWLFGGLNFQIEHHLFPRVCHVHYRHLAPIVRKTAEEFDLPYQSFDTFLDAVRSHLRYLKQVGSTAASR